MLTQAAISINGKKALIFCRLNAIYYAAFSGSKPSEPLIMQNGVEPGFNICSDSNGGFLIFFKTIQGAGAAIRVTSGGISRPKLSPQALALSSGKIFIYSGRDIFYTLENGGLYRKNSSGTSVISKSPDFCQSFLLSGENYILYSNEGRLFIYHCATNIPFELSRQADSVQDVSFCSCQGIIHAAVLLKTHSGFELSYRSLTSRVLSKPISLIKTQQAENCFIFPSGENVNIVLTTPNGRIITRRANAIKQVFMPSEQSTASGCAKIQMYDASVQSCSSSLLTMSDGTIIMPETAGISHRTESRIENADNEYKKAIMEKDKTIASITSELSKLQKNASGAISQIREALNSEIEKNSELTEKITFLENKIRDMENIEKSISEDDETETPLLSASGGESGYFENTVNEESELSRQGQNAAFDIIPLPESSGD